MKPEQFIREFGIEKAREVVESASENHNKFDIALDKTVEAYKVRPNLVDLHYLKRLVESVELIEELGGIKLVKDHGRKGGLYGGRVITAIRDHESIYGGGDE
ncbi:hypothetical protein OIN82_14345 [Acinetobacter baumannii]|nr:hypothetical protein [Acinetobacter baumannii]